MPSSQRFASFWPPSPELGEASGSTALAVLGGAAVVVVVFHVLTLQGDFTWFGDVPAYLYHATNLLEGRPYTQTGYIQNPDNYLAPRAYPPGYPLVLLPVIFLFGLSPFALQAQGIVFFAGALLVLAYALRRDLGLPLATLLILAVGLHPFFATLKYRLIPDVSFTLWVYAGLALYRSAVDRKYEQSASRSAPSVHYLAFSLLAGLCLAYAFLTRTVGLALLPCIILHDLIRLRRLSIPCLMTLGAFVLAYGVEQALMVSGGTGSDAAGGGYGMLVQINILNRIGSVFSDLPSVALRYGRIADGLWENGYSRSVQHALFLLTLFPCVLGFLHRLWRQRSIFEWFTLLYLLALLPWTFVHLRYALPLLPLYVAYLLYGVRLIILLLALPQRTVARAVLAGGAFLALVGTYTARYTTLDETSGRPVFTEAAAQDLYRYVQQHTAPGDVFIAAFPRQFAFFTRRDFSVPPRKEAGLLPYAQRIGARYVVVGPLHEATPWTNTCYALRDAVRSRPEHFEEVYANAAFSLYRVRAVGEPAAGRGAVLPRAALRSRLGRWANQLREEPGGICTLGKAEERCL